MKLLDLTLTNFQGIKSLWISPDGEDVSIYGDNGTGKTTVYNAFTWLLFGVPSTGAKGYTPKSRDANGEAHGLEHSAEAKLISEDGRVVTLKRSFREVYKKKRGSASEEFDGHTTDFYVNGVPTKEKEYADIVADLLGSSEKAKMLSMIHYFAEDMSWLDRRKVLLSMVGDVSDEDVISASEELVDLHEVLLIPGTASERYTVEEFMKIAAAKKAEINRELITIPARMDEASKATPALPGESKREIEDRLELARKKKEEAEALVASLKRDGASASIRGKIADERAKLSQCRRESEERRYKQTEAAREALSDLRDALREINRDIAEKQISVDALSDDVYRMETLRSKLLSEYKETLDKVWDEREGVCPTCGRPLPIDEVQKAMDAFNLAKSVKLSAINERGKREASATAIEQAKNGIKEARESIDVLKNKAERVSAQIKEAEAALVAVAPLEQSELERSILAKIAELEKALQSADASAEIAEAEEAVRGYERVIQTEVGKLATLDLAKAQEARLDELKQRERELAAAFAQMEKGVYLCELFIRKKVGMLTDRINGVFDRVRFSLFAEQINGGIREECEVLVPCDGRLIPYAFANNAARINAGIEIVDALGDHFGVRCPIFVDNAESVTRMISAKTQVIRLVVSEADKELRVQM